MTSHFALNLKLVYLKIQSVSLLTKGIKINNRLVVLGSKNIIRQLMRGSFLFMAIHIALRQIKKIHNLVHRAWEKLWERGWKIYTYRE